MKRILRTFAIAFFIVFCIAAVMAAVVTGNLLFDRYVTGWPKHLPWLVPLYFIFSGAWALTAPKR